MLSGLSMYNNRMKRLISNILLLLLATMISYIGAGINITSFCCNDCRETGTMHKVEMSCCASKQIAEVDHGECEGDAEAKNCANDMKTETLGAQNQCCKRVRLEQ